MGRVRAGVVLLACVGCAEASLPGASDGAITFGSGSAMESATDTPTSGNPSGETENDDDPIETNDPSADSDPSDSGPEGVCGDAVVEGDEQCDLGAENAADGLCTDECQIASCGDGMLQELEECDDGNGDNTDACIDNCRAAVCGDGWVQSGQESCDDENDVDDDGCGNDCILSSCGDGTVQAPEECDDANTDNADACIDTCTSAVCGDGEVQGGVEECDDGENGDNGDACVVGCQNAECGDGYVHAGAEECDDGDLEAGDGCDGGCLAEAVVFSRDFTGGVPASGGDCDAWNTFRGALQDNHNSITISGTNDMAGRTCNGAGAAQLCTALRNGTATSVACNGHTWFVDDCLGIELTADDAGCTCMYPGYSVRPCIMHTDYGGANTDTCSSPSQNITVTCGY